MNSFKIQHNKKQTEVFNSVGFISVKETVVPHQEIQTDFSIASSYNNKLKHTQYTYAYNTCSDYTKNPNNVKYTAKYIKLFLRHNCSRHSILSVTN